MGYFASSGASIAGLAVWAGVRFQMGWVNAVSLQLRDGLLNAWWITAFVPFAIIFGTTFALDAWRWAFDGTRRSFSSASFTRGFEPFEELFARLMDVMAREASPERHEAKRSDADDEAGRTGSSCRRSCSFR